MSEWWTYRAEDFLLFSPRVYWRMFELHNAALWPLHVLTLAAGLIIILLIAWRPGTSARWIAFILAMLWILVGWSFLWNRYATINWAAAYVAPAFFVEGALLIVVSLLNGLAFDRRGPAGWIGYLILAFALAGQPLLAPLQGRGWASSEVFGIAPDPTAIATLGVLLLARGRLLPCAAADPRSLVPPERHDAPDDGRAASLGSSCCAGARRCSLDLDDHPSARHIRRTELERRSNYPTVPGGRRISSARAIHYRQPVAIAATYARCF